MRLALCVLIVTAVCSPAVFNDINTAQQSKTYNYYFGTLHAHYYGINGGDDGGLNLTTDERDSKASATYAFEYAMKKGLDFFALTPHVQNPMYVEYTSAEYEDLKQRAAEFNSLHKGEFVAIAGYQWGSDGTGGHIIVLDAPTRCPVTNGDFTALYQWLATENIKCAIFAHMYRPTNFNDGAYNYLGDLHVQGFELANGPAKSKCEDFGDTPTTYENRYIQMLDNGWHIGAVASQDNHYQNWGATTEARTVVLAESLTKDNILNALQARRCYASTDMTARVAFEASNGAIMGEVFRTQPTDVKFTVRISDDAGDTFRLIQLFCDGRVVDGISLKNVNEYVWTSSPQSAAKNHYWFVKIVQTDGDIIWTSPIWSDEYVEDELPPQVVDVMPLHNSTSVPTNTAIFVNFSEPMATAATENAFSIVPAANGSINWLNFNATLCWTPNTLLKKNETYYVAIRGSAADVAGNELGYEFSWQFTTTGEEDTIPPTVVSTYPYPNSKNVKVDTKISITFSEPMQKESVVRNVVTYPPVELNPETIKWLGTTIEFKFVSYLQVAKNYTIRIVYKAMDLAGNTLDGNKNGIAEENDDYFFTFSTEKPPPVPPKVVDYMPKPGKNVPNTTYITILFSESMNTQTLVDGFSIQPGVEGIFEFSEQQRKLVFKPLHNLTNNMQYIVCLNASRVTDIYGNFLDGNGDGSADGWPIDDFRWQFKVAGFEDESEKIDFLLIIGGTIFLCLAVVIVIVYKVAKRKREEKMIAAELLARKQRTADLIEYLKKSK